jgi:hypothetical protein
MLTPSQVKRMIGRNDDRRKEDAVKKAELELKKKKEEAVREVCVAVPSSCSTVNIPLADTMLQTPDAVVHVLPAQHSLGSCEYIFLGLMGRKC